MENKYMEKDVEFRSSKELPLEVIELEILPLIPAKSLGRFMCVCKQWKTIISSPEFIRKNLHRVSKSLANLKLLETCWVEGSCTFRTYTFTTSDCEALNTRSSIVAVVPFDFHNCEVCILGSMDGLVCVTLRPICKVILWNPLTGAYKMLSNTNHRPCYDNYYDGFGFYYDSFNNDYKLLHVVPNGATGAYIYSQRSDSWRKIQYLQGGNYRCTLPYDYMYHWSPATFVSESLYFVVGNRDDSWLIAFDVKSEKFRQIQFPPVPNGVSFYGSLVVVNGCVHLCVSYLNNQTYFARSIDKWSKKEDGKGELWKLMDGDCWKKVADFCGKEHYPMNSFKRVHVTRSGNSHMILEVKDNTFNKINIEDLATKFSINCDGIFFPSTLHTTYVETLVSPHC